MPCTTLGLLQLTGCLCVMEIHLEPDCLKCIAGLWYYSNQPASVLDIAVRHAGWASFAFA